MKRIVVILTLLLLLFSCNQEYLKDIENAENLIEEGSIDEAVQAYKGLFAEIYSYTYEKEIRYGNIFESMAENLTTDAQVGIFNDIINESTVEDNKGKNSDYIIPYILQNADYSDEDKMFFYNKYLDWNLDDDYEMSYGYRDAFTVIADSSFSVQTKIKLIQDIVDKAAADNPFLSSDEYYDMVTNSYWSTFVTKTGDMSRPLDELFMDSLKSYINTKELVIDEQAAKEYRENLELYGDDPEKMEDLYKYRDTGIRYALDLDAYAVESDENYSPGKILPVYIDEGISISNLYYLIPEESRASGTEEVDTIVFIVTKEVIVNKYVTLIENEEAGLAVAYFAGLYFYDVKSESIAKMQSILGEEPFFEIVKQTLQDSTYLDPDRKFYGDYPALDIIRYFNGVIPDSLIDMDLETTVELYSLMVEAEMG